jgi:hypothetical protein
MERGDFFIIGGKWVANSSRIMIYSDDPNDRQLLPDPAAAGDMGIVLKCLVDDTRYFTFFKNFYHVLFTNCVSGLVHRDFLLKIE